MKNTEKREPKEQTAFVKKKINLQNLTKETKLGENPEEDN